MDRPNESGNPLLPVHSMPVKPDDSKYISELNRQETRVFEIYKKLENSKDEAKLLELVSSGKLSPTDCNKEGQTPLMFAVDTSFSSKTILKLIELGCDVNAAGDDGMTCLHKSYWCENSETFSILLSKGADPDLEDGDKDTGRTLAEQNPEFLRILKQATDPNSQSQLAVSLSMSAAEKEDELNKP